MSQASVSAGFASKFIEFAVAKGAKRAALMKRSHIDASNLKDSDNRIAFSNYVALMQAAKELTDDPALALHFGEAVNIAEVSIVGLIGQASETIVEAIMQVNRYLPLVVDVGDADRFQLKRERRGLWLVDTRPVPNEFPELTESAFAQIVCGSRQFGETNFVKAVHVTHAAPRHRAEYERIFRAPVTFESDRNALLVDRAWLTHKVACLPRYAFSVLSEHAQALLTTLDASKTTKGHVESKLLPVLHGGEARIEAIAAKLGLSRRTLARKLKAEGTTFKAVLDELRRTMALHYLHDRSVSVHETARLIGFSDSTVLSRAFKRWTGSSPRALKARNAGM